MEMITMSQERYQQSNVCLEMEAHEKINRISMEYSDLELHLLQSFGTFASSKIIETYVGLKNSSTLIRLFIKASETLVVRTGIYRLTSFFFRQYLRLSLPVIAYVDDAMGKRIIQAFVALLLHATALEETEESVENGHLNDVKLKLSLEERLQGLLQGDLPTIQRLLAHLQQQQQQEEHFHQRLNPPPLPLIMDLKDFVRVEDVRAIKETNDLMRNEQEQAILRLKQRCQSLEKEKQVLEQQLTDVHTYQETERGKQFQQMEEQLAHAKLEMNQKVYELRKLEIMHENVLQKQKTKRKTSRSGTPKSIANISDGVPANTSTA